MGFLKRFAALLRVIRMEEWLQQVTSITVCFLLLLVVSDAGSLSLWLTPLVIVYSAALASFGFTLNSLCDREQDAKAGKLSDASVIGSFSHATVATTALVVAVGCLLLLKSSPALMLGILNILLVAAYSSPFPRLKEKGMVGVITGALTQRALPFFVFAIIIEPVPMEAWFLLIWLSVLGTQLMLVHQLEDFERDRLARVNTWAQSQGRKRSLQWVLVATTMTVIVSLLAMLLYEAPGGIVISSVLLLLSARSMLWTGGVLLEQSASIDHRLTHTRLSNRPLGRSEESDVHVALGRTFLLERIRRNELCTRAPEDSLHKNWDWKGEAYLALNVILALDDELPADEAAELAQRLISLQQSGAWDYTNGGRGPDSDTTASAIRALDRLGENIGLQGLQSFLNSDSGLHNTFRKEGEYGGLKLPPQTKDSHFGAHPCVLPNIWLLFRERGLLQSLSRPLLKKVQGESGLWSGYFYASPYYSTRLYCELLCSFEENYTSELEATLQALLRVDPPSSPPQQAEILISLCFLRARFPAYDKRISERSETLAASLRDSQMQDGSWTGETVWTFAHREHPDPVEGYDALRVHSTSLAVRALNLWQPQQGMADR